MLLEKFNVAITLDELHELITHHDTMAGILGRSQFDPDAGIDAAGHLKRRAELWGTAINWPTVSISKADA